MAINFPGPYEIRLFYTTSISGIVLSHEQRLNVRLETDPDPGDSFTTINALRRDDSPFSLDSEVDDWVTLFLALYPSTACVVSHAELWKYTPGTFLSSFVSTYPIATAGTGGANLVPAGQYIITFRTQEGGIMKLNFMETVVVSGALDTPPLANAAAEAIRNAVQNGTVPWLARDTSYPFATIAGYPGINEALFKKRYRNG